MASMQHNPMKNNQVRVKTSKCRLELSGWRNMAHLKKGFNRLKSALEKIRDTENVENYHYLATREAMNAIHDVNEMEKS